MRLTFILICLIAALACTTNAQDLPTPYLFTKSPVGYNRTTGQPILSTNYTFPYGVYNASSASTDHLVLVLRKISNNRFGNRGFLLAINPETGLVHWEKDILRFNIKFTNDLILYNTDESTRIMNKHTGVFMHSTRYDIKLLDYMDNKGLTYGGTYLDLMNNKVLWNQNLSLDAGPVQAQYLNDSTMLIASSGLHLVNTRTGKGWHYKMNTSKGNMSEALVIGAFFGVAGVALGSALTAASPGSFSSRAFGLSSNMVYDTAAGIVYYSAINSTVALSMNGKEVWKKELRKAESSTSYLWQNGNNLILINFGYALTSGGPAQQGTPFMISYNEATGDTVYNRVLGKFGFVTSFHSIGGHTLLKIYNGLFLYNHNTGDLVRQVELDKKQQKKNPLEVTDGKDWYVMNPDSSFRSLNSLNEGSFLAIDTAAIYRLDDRLTKTKECPLADLWRTALFYDDVIFLRNGPRIAITSGGRLKGFIDASGHLTVVGDKLLIADQERLAIIPLANIM